MREKETLKPLIIDYGKYDEQTRELITTKLIIISQKEWYRRLEEDRSISALMGLYREIEKTITLFY